MIDDPSGFWKLVDKVTFEKNLRSVLRLTCDRFEEARFHAWNGIRMAVNKSNIDKINWCINAHLVATIGIEHAAKQDFIRINKGNIFSYSPIKKEFYMPSTSNGKDDYDPVAINRAYRDIRNLSVHHAIMPVEIREKMLWHDFMFNGNDIIEPKRIRKHWFFKSIDVQKHKEMQNTKHKPHVKEDEIIKFNEYIEHKTVANVVAQHLFTLYAVIRNTYESCCLTTG